MKRTIKILILDDSEVDIEKSSRALIDDGYETPIMSCRDEMSFLIQLDEFNPDVIIAEHTIPNYNSFRALDDARQKLPNVIFILVTDDVPEEFALEVLKEGVDDYVFKNHLLRLPYAIENAQIKREYIEETRKLAEINKELTSANFAIDEKNQSLTKSIVLHKESKVYSYQTPMSYWRTFGRLSWYINQKILLVGIFIGSRKRMIIT